MSPLGQLGSTQPGPGAYTRPKTGAARWEVKVGQVWAHRDLPALRFTVRRKRTRTVLGDLTSHHIPLTAQAALRYTALGVKWELVE